MSRLAWVPWVGGLVLAVWGGVFWGALYDPLRVYDDLPGGVAEAAALLKARDVPTGTYFFPWPRNTAQTRAAFLEGHRQGPFLELAYVREGADSEAPSKFLMGLLQYALVAALGVLLVWLARRPGPLRVGLLVSTAGLMGSVFAQLSHPIWFHTPWHHALMLLLHDAVAWGLLGLVLARLLRQPAAAAAR